MTTEFIRGLINLTPQSMGCVATIGNFDGVHLGHQALLKRIKEKAKMLNVPSLVITFEPQPLEFFSRECAVPRLTRWREKFYQLSQFNIDKVLVIRFNNAFAQLTATEFVKKLLVEQLQVKEIVVGDDFHFGKSRLGDVDLLKKMGENLGFLVEIMPSILVDQQRVSSTRVRQELESANYPLVRQLLGRPYSMMGRVVYGNQRGRIIGFPTANIYLHRHVTPVLGVYIVRLYGVTAKGLPGVANVGIRPTVDGTRTLLEVHLFNFNENIYGKYVWVEFCEKLRNEKRFENLDLLKEQIWQDAKLARRYFVKSGELPNNESE